jgi:hypothetical protein
VLDNCEKENASDFIKKTFETPAGGPLVIPSLD